MCKKKKVKKNGFLVFSVGIDVDNVQHNLMKLISRKFGKRNSDIEINAEFFRDPSRPGPYLQLHSENHNLQRTVQMI